MKYTQSQFVGSVQQKIRNVFLLTIWKNGCDKSLNVSGSPAKTTLFGEFMRPAAAPPGDGCEIAGDMVLNHG